MAEAGPEKPGIEITNQYETVSQLYRLVSEAQRHLFLVSPYVSLDKLRTLVRHLQAALARGVKVKLVIRDKDVSTGNSDALASESIRPLRDAGMEIFVLKDLHAKIYLSEKNALLTSLNLLESSFNNSIEVGTWLTAGTPEYERLVGFLRKEIHPTAVKVTALPEPAVLAVAPTSSPARKSPARRQTAREDSPPSMDFAFEDSDDEEGSCIRCAESIDFEPERPLCKDCYAVWKRYGDPEYPEEYCHACGDESATSMAKPLCRDCYRNNRNASF